MNFLRLNKWLYKTRKLFTACYYNIQIVIQTSSYDAFSGILSVCKNIYFILDFINKILSLVQLEFRLNELCKYVREFLYLLEKIIYSFHITTSTCLIFQTLHYLNIYLIINHCTFNLVFSNF